MSRAHDNALLQLHQTLRLTIFALVVVVVLAIGGTLGVEVAGVVLDVAAG